MPSSLQVLICIPDPCCVWHMLQTCCPCIAYPIQFVACLPCYAIKGVFTLVFAGHLRRRLMESSDEGLGDADVVFIICGILAWLGPQQFWGHAHGVVGRGHAYLEGVGHCPAVPFLLESTALKHVQVLRNFSAMPCTYGQARLAFNERNACIVVAKLAGWELITAALEQPKAIGLFDENPVRTVSHRSSGPFWACSN